MGPGLGQEQALALMASSQLDVSAARCPGIADTAWPGGSTQLSPHEAQPKGPSGEAFHLSRGSQAEPGHRRHLSKGVGIPQGYGGIFQFFEGINGNNVTPAKHIVSD